MCMYTGPRLTGVDRLPFPSPSSPPRARRTPQLPDDPDELKLLVVELDAELKVKKGQLRDKVALLRDKVAAKEVELRERDALLRNEEKERERVSEALASSNTKLLRFTRTYVRAASLLCVDGPTDGRPSPDLALPLLHLQTS